MYVVKFIKILTKLANTLYVHKIDNFVSLGVELNGVVFQTNNFTLNLSSWLFVCVANTIFLVLKLGHYNYKTMTLYTGWFFSATTHLRV